jgi:hypothetical protein
LRQYWKNSNGLGRRVEPDAPRWVLPSSFPLALSSSVIVMAWASLPSFCDELLPAQHVRPLVVAAELHVSAVLDEELIKIVALHDSS